MYTGMLDLCPRIIVDQSTFETSRNTRGRNHILGTVSIIQRQVVKIPVVSQMVLSMGDFVIRRG